jgi:hypothetical protein
MGSSPEGFGHAALMVNEGAATIWVCFNLASYS